MELKVNYVLAVSVLCLFLAVPWAGLWSVIMAFSGRILTCLFRFGSQKKHNNY